MNSNLLILPLLIVSMLGCDVPHTPSENPSTTNRASEGALSRTEANQNPIATTVVSLRNPHSVKRFLEAELAIQFEETTIGFKADSKRVEAEIWTVGSDNTVTEFHVLFDPLSDESVEKCLQMTRRILKASGEDAYEIEDKVDRGRDAFPPQSDDDVELRFANGAYVRFSVWVRGDQERVGVVISPN